MSVQDVVDLPLLSMAVMALVLPMVVPQRVGPTPPGLEGPPRCLLQGSIVAAL